MLLSPDVALLSFEATARWNDQADTSKTLCATVYVKRAMVWRVAFHQKTAAIEIQRANVLNTRCAPIRYTPHAPRPDQFGG